MDDIDDKANTRANTTELLYIAMSIEASLEIGATLPQWMKHNLEYWAGSLHHIIGEYEIRPDKGEYEIRP